MSDPSSSKSASDKWALVVYDEADENSSKPIPDRWRLVTTTGKNGSKISYYLCPETRQRFSTYEDLMRYVHYAEAAMVSIYSPYFRARPRKGDIPPNSQLLAGPSTEMPASDQGEEEEEDESSSEDTSSDSEDFDVPENDPTEEELNSISEIYALPPMDSIILLPNESEKKEDKNSSKNRSMMKGFTSKGKRKRRERRVSLTKTVV